MKQPSSYRIGYLNPWSDTAENQAFFSLREAAVGLGHELISMSTSDEIIAASPDFVIAIASGQPKTTHIPTFASVHEPRLRYWEDEAYFKNLLTYDGYLTISDSLRDFLKAFCAGFGKEPHIGYYYNTPQRQNISADVASLAATSRMGVCYFGTNWDVRSRPLFRELSRRDYFEARGPEKSWRYLKRGYYGSVPFDGKSVQATYAARGAGLVVLSRNHALDDVISNRIFEIASVGAVAICPDRPWIRENFGETVYYYDPWAPAAAIARRVDEIVAEMRADPGAAADRAAGARLIFEKSFCAERMVANAVDYYVEWSERTLRARSSAGPNPTIDVIVRVGGRPPSVILNAIRSIDAQTAGAFRVIFVRYRPIDLQSIIEADWKRLTSFEVVDCIGGRRAATLAAGIRALEAPYFAVLDDDDFWLPEHIAGLWRALKPLPAGKGFAYSGWLEVAEVLEDPKSERRTLRRLAPAEGDFWSIMGAFGMITFLAARELTDGLDLDDWTLSTAEDTVLIGHMLSRCEAAFSWRATACAVSSADGGSNFRTSPRRNEDVLEAFLRLGERIERIERAFPPLSMSVWRRLGMAVRAVFEQKADETVSEEGVLVLEEGMASVSLHDRDDVTAAPLPLDGNAHINGQGQFVNNRRGLQLRSTKGPWDYGVTIRLPQQRKPGAFWVVLEFESLSGGFGAGLLNADGTDFITRVEMPKRSHPLELWLHAPAESVASAIVVQNWGNTEEKTAHLSGVWIVHKNAA